MRSPRRTQRRRHALGRLVLVLALAVSAGVAAEAPKAGLCLALDPVIRLGCEVTPSAPAAGQAAQPGEQLEEAPVTRTSAVARYNPRRLAVTFEPGTSRSTVRHVLARAKVTVERSIPAIDAYMVGVAPERRAAALESLRDSQAVATASREAISDAVDTTPDDAAWPQQAGLRLTGFPKAWDVTHGSNRVVVAVLDTGVDPAQRDLRDGLVPGYDFVNSDPDPSDDHGHGTAVAGIIGARANNREGLAGICWSCPIMPVKVLNEKGEGDDSVIAAGIVWATDHGARVINMSLGGPDTTPDLSDAIAYAVSKGAVVVAAAGNTGTTDRFYPAADPNSVGVAGTTAADKLYPWSNYGPWVSVAAPGCNIAPVLAGGYGPFCGTSAATPVVAGLAALALSVDPNATPAEVAQALEHPALPLEGLVQYGRINAPQTLSAIRPAPQAAAPAASTAVIRGTVGGGVRTRSYSIAVGAGQLTTMLAFTGARTLKLSLLPSRGGKPIARTAGASPLKVAPTLPSGTVRFVIEGARRRASFVLTVSYLKQPTG
jgi:subtilisin family serine protease